MPYDLQGVYAKLDRADYHLEQLRSELRADPGGNYHFTTDSDRKTNEHIIVYRMPKDISLRYGIIAGEVISQIRSALDHTVWAMVPVANRDRCSFPVFDNKRGYIKYGLPKIHGINSSASTIIEGLQPFNCGGPSAPVYILNKLWNRDKHQILNFVGGAVDAYKRIYFLKDGTTREIVADVPRRRLEDGAEVIRVKHPDFYRPQMRVVTHMTLCLKFWDDDIAPDKEVTELLANLIEFGKGVVEVLAATS